MLFTLYTKISKTIKSVKKIVNLSIYRTALVLLVLVTLPSCSTKTKEESPTNNSTTNNTAIERDKGTKELEEISKDITNMVSVDVPNQDNKQTAKPDEPINSLITNSFIAQESSRMSGVPLAVIEKYKSALSLMESKNWQAANKLFDEVIVEQPQLSGSYVNKAIILQQGDKNSLALIEVEKAIKVNDINPYAHHLKGLLLKTQGQFEQAEQSYTKALEIWPNYAKAQVNMAILLELYRGKLLKAYDYYQSYLAFHPDDTQVKRWLAALNIKLKREGLTPIKQVIEEKGAN